MFHYNSRTGELFHDAKALASAYSGAGEGKNNPALEHLHNVGPIPAGFYVIGFPYDSHTHGPYVLPLTPLPDTQTFGRDQFLIHGDSIQAPGTASKGCIIAPHWARVHIGVSGETLLEVFHDEPPDPEQPRDA